MKVTPSAAVAGARGAGASLAASIERAGTWSIASRITASRSSPSTS